MRHWPTRSPRPTPGGLRRHVRRPGYGELAVSEGAVGLRVRLGEEELETQHRHYDTWDIRHADLEMSFPATFQTDAEGTVREVVVPLEALTEPIRFVRAP